MKEKSMHQKLVDEEITTSEYNNYRAIRMGYLDWNEYQNKRNHITGRHKPSEKRNIEERFWEKDSLWK